MKKTAWFPADVKPTHIGVYEVQNMYDSEQSLFNYWSGKGWTGSAQTIDGLAMEERPHAFAWQDRVWRGLKEPA